MKKIDIKKTGETVYYEKLSNGLELYLLPNEKVKNFYITLSTKFGSIHTNFKHKGEVHESPKGVAHFLEHILFNMPDGTNTFEYFGSLGSSINAFTSYDITCYEVFANRLFKENLEYLLKYVYTPHFTKEMINNEKGIITEEIKMISDDPNSEIVYGLYRNIFVEDEYKYLISGTTEDVKKISLKDIEASYNAFYHPANMFLIITGNFNSEEALAIVNETLKNFEFEDYQKPTIIKEKEPYKVNKEYEEKTAPVDKHKVTIGLKIPKSNFKALKLNELELRLYLNLIMKVNFGSTSIFREELISNGIVVDGVSNFLMMSDEYIIEAFIVSTEYPDYFIKRLKDELKNIKLDKEELERKLRSSISNLIMSFDDIEMTNADIQDDILNYGEYVTNISEYYRKMNVETAIKIIEKLDKYKISVNVLVPKEEK